MDTTKQTEKPIQMMTLAEVCTLLRKSRSGLYKLMAADPTFPVPIKEGTARSSRAFFVMKEIAEWQQRKLNGRDDL